VVHTLEGEDTRAVQNPFNRVSAIDVIVPDEKDSDHRVVAVSMPDKKGITHKIFDPSFPNPLLVGLAKGPTTCEYLRVLGAEVECLLDPGANVSLIGTRCLKFILEKNGIEPRHAELHDPVNASGTAANGSELTFAAAITLPIERNGEPIYVELQIPHDKPSFPIIIGTNALSSLGYQLLDSFTGKDYLRIAPSPKPVKSHNTNANGVHCDKESIIQPFTEMSVLCCTNVPDGEYFCQRVGGSCATIASVIKGQLLVPIENRSAVATRLLKGELIGQLEPVDEVYTSAEIASSALIDELVQGIECEADANRLETLLNLLPQPECLLDSDQRKSLNDLLDEFTDVFALKSSELGRTDLVQHSIELLDQRPIRQPPRPIPFALREKVAGMIHEYLERKLIRPSNSPYSNPIVLVRKKDGSLRFCVDYRKLNSVTKKDAYPLPNIDATLLSIGTMKFAASLDCDGAYWQIGMSPDSVEKTAFPTPNGLYEWIVMPFGLTNAVATYQRFMERVMNGLIGKSLHVYLDDLLVLSQSWEEHLSNLRTVFERLRQAGVKLKPSKCRLVAKEIQFLGHILTSDGVKSDPSKVAAIKSYPIPMDVVELRRFLGLIGYYRKFIKGFALIAKPLHALLKKGVTYEWSPDCQESFERLIHLLSDDITLAYPDFQAAKDDPKRALIIQTDASRDGIAGVLGQMDGQGGVRPIIFVSRACSPAESKYPPTELEALALKFVVHKSSAYIIGLRTIVETDHSALVQMFSKTNGCNNARVDRWAMQLNSLYDLEYRYKPGKNNVNADALSRAFPKESAIVNATMLDFLENPTARLPEGIEKYQWVSKQQEGEFSSLYKYIESRTLPTEPEEARVVLASLPQFTLIEQILYYVDPTTSAIRLTVPEEYRRQIFHEHHGGPYGTHSSAPKVYDILKRDFYWTNMRRDCEHWCRECPVCAFTRDPRLNKPPLYPIVASYNFELVCMDTIKLGPTKSGNLHALVVIDHFTKWLIVEPLKSKSSEDIARAFVDRVVLVHGVPQRIHSDQGTEFVNKIVDCLKQVFRMGQSTTAGYNPRANGVTERVNRDLVKMLQRSCVIPQEWDLRIPFAAFSHNITVHRSTGETPFYLMHGRDPNFPSSVDRSLLPQYNTDVEGFRGNVAENVSQAIERVQKATNKARDAFKKHYDSGNKVVNGKYKIGQRVLVVDPRLNISGNRKLKWKFNGPYRVINIEGTNAEVRPVDKPHATTEWLPLDRLNAIPDVCVAPKQGAKGRDKAIQQEQDRVLINCLNGNPSFDLNPGGLPPSCPSRSTHFPLQLTRTSGHTTSDLPKSVNMENPVHPNDCDMKSCTSEDSSGEASTKCPHPETHLVLVPRNLPDFVDSPVTQRNFTNIPDLLSVFRNLDLATTGPGKVLVLLPASVDGSATAIQGVFDIFGAYPSLEFFVVPPPPSYHPDYPKTVDLLLAQAQHPLALGASGPDPSLVRLHWRCIE